MIRRYNNGKGWYKPGPPMREIKKKGSGREREIWREIKIRYVGRIPCHPFPLETHRGP